MKRRKFILLSTGTAASAGVGILSSFTLTNPNMNETPDNRGDRMDKSGGYSKELNPNTAWLRHAKWGVFSHYLAHMPSAPVPPGMTGEAWNKRVNSFNTKILAEQLSSAGVQYYFITIGQGGGYYCSPNGAYERLFGPSLGKLAKRDLIADIAKELKAKDIRFGVYLPAVGRDDPESQQFWRAVIEEWSVRWGRAISAWWIDGKYARQEEFRAFTQAFKAGNPDVLVSYNTGPVGMNRDQLMPATTYEDYLAGEVDYFLPTCGIRVFDGKKYYQGPNISGDQLHFLNFLGAWWGTGEPRFSDDLVTSWTKHVNDHGGAVTWDIPLSHSGYISESYMRQLIALKKTTLITFASLLREMSDPASLARWPDIQWQSLQDSALKTEERNNPGYFANKAIGHFIRVEEKEGRREWVLMEHEGPGVVARMWAPNMAKDATLRMYFDEDTRPSIEVNMMDFFYGKDFAKPPFAALKARGGNVYLPIPFEKGCKITVDRNFCGWAEPADLFYIIQYRTYARGTPIKTFDIEQYKNHSSLLSEVTQDLEHPAIASFSPVILIDKYIDTGKSEEIILRNDNRAINYLSLKIEAHDLKSALRSTIIKLCFDNNETVNCPVGDFFGSGHGLNPFSDWMRTIEQNGRMFCRWIMPYKKTVKIKLECNGLEAIKAILSVNHQPWYWDSRSMYFHSNWGFDKGINDLPVSNFNYISVKGKGIYVGDTLSITNYSPKWWGEGPAKILVDGEPFPSHFGTGTEDYYGYAWGDRKVFDAPFHAQPRIPDGPDFLGTTVNTRIRALDAIPFQSSFDLNMEVLTQGSMANEFAELDYGVATYWYGLPGAEGEWKAI